MTDTRALRWTNVLGKLLGSTVVTVIFAITGYLIGYSNGRSQGFSQALDVTSCLVSRISDEPSRSAYCLRMEARLLEKD